MEENNRRSATGDPAAMGASSADWRAQLQPEFRRKGLAFIWESLKEFHRVDNLKRLRDIVVKFERNVYTNATSQSDYIEKIQKKLENVCKRNQQTASANSSMSNSHGGNQNPAEPVILDSPAHTGHVGLVDWQEEIYQEIKSLKERYLTPLRAICQEIALKMMQVDPQKVPLELSGLYEKMKVDKHKLEHIISILQISKKNIPPVLKERVHLYKESILKVLPLHRRTKTIPSQLQGQLQQSSLYQATSMQPTTLSSMKHVSMPSTTQLSVSKAQRNIVNASQDGSSMMISSQGTYFSSPQQGGIGSGQQEGMGSLQNIISAHQQINNSILSWISLNTSQPNLSHMQLDSNLLKKKHAKQQNHEGHQQQLIQLQHKHLLLPPQSLQQQFCQQQTQHQERIHRQVLEMDEVNKSKVGQGPGIELEFHQQYHSQNHHHKRLKAGISLQNIQAFYPQNPCHSSSQIDQHRLEPSLPKGGIPLQSKSLPFLVPSTSTTLAPSPIPRDDVKHPSVISSQKNADSIGHQRKNLVPAQAKLLTIGRPGISASPLLAEFTSSDGNRTNVSAISKARAGERPLEHLINVVQSLTPEALKSSVTDIKSVVSMIDMIAALTPSNGYRPAVGEDFSAETKWCLQARSLVPKDGGTKARKIKRHFDAMPLNIMPPAGDANNCSLDKPNLESAGTSRVKRHKAEANHILLEDIREINRQLIGTVVSISDEDASLVDDDAASGGGEGTVVQCSFNAALLSPWLKSQIASAEMPPLLSLRMLVSADYPTCSPILLGKDEPSREVDDDLSTKAKSRFNKSLNGLSQPISLGQMVRSWDACARRVVTEYAQQAGGGTVSTRCGAWENCVGA